MLALAFLALLCLPQGCERAETRVVGARHRQEGRDLVFGLIGGGHGRAQAFLLEPRATRVRTRALVASPSPTPLACEENSPRLNFRSRRKKPPKEAHPQVPGPETTSNRANKPHANATRPPRLAQHHPLPPRNAPPATSTLRTAQQPDRPALDVAPRKGSLVPAARSLERNSSTARSGERHLASIQT